MFYFALVNVALVFVYAVFEWKGIAPTSHGYLGGIALAYLFEYASKTRPPGEILMLIVAASFVTLLLSYSFVLVVTNDHLIYLMLCLVIGTVFCALLATTLYCLVDRRKVSSVLGWMAFCATTMNSLPLISYLLK